MCKKIDIKSLIEWSHENNPMSVFQTEFDYLALNEKQKKIIESKQFTPHKHVFAQVDEEVGGIKCVELESPSDIDFKRYLEELEKSILPFTYLGKSDAKGKVIFTCP